jgi:hypothetical protein
MKHKLNNKNQDGTTADACKNADNLTSSKPIANAYVSSGILSFNVIGQKNFDFIKGLPKVSKEDFNNNKR